MKILAIGCMHGKFPKKLENRLQKENFDLIVGVGDYADTSKFRELEFKYWKKLGSKKDFAEVVGKRKYLGILKKQSKSQEIILKKLKKYNKPIIIIYGNSDFLKKNAKKYDLEGIESQCKSLKIKLFKTNIKKVEGFVLAGFSGYRVASTKGFVSLNKKDKKRVKNFNEKWKKRLEKLANKLKKYENVIFIGHDVPYGYFDLIKYKKSPLRGKRIGDKYFTNFIKKHQPDIFICSHMHEYQGIKKLGKTSIITTGAGQDGKAAIIDCVPGKKVKVKFFN